MVTPTERRLTAILAADVAGYSLLMNANEEGTYAAWKSARIEVIDPAIDAAQGRVVKHTGDGFLAEFPTVLAAVECGVAIQEQMARRNEDVPADQRFAFRIGINLGDIIVDQDDIHGDGVNIAARLESIADAGGMCISGDVYNQISTKLNLNYQDLGKRTVKNIRKPIRAFSITIGDDHGKRPDSGNENRLAEPPARASIGERRSLPFDEGSIDVRDILAGVAQFGQRSDALVVGRDHEKALLRQAFKDAQAMRGNIVLIRGEPGIGKTSLAYSFAEEVEAAGALIVDGHCHETLGSPPFWPWLQIFKGLQKAADSVELPATNIFESLSASQSHWPAGLTSTFANSGGAEHFAVFSRIASSISQFAAGRTLVIVLDDIHWADKSSLLLLTHLCGRLSKQSIMVIGTYRDHEITRKHPLFEALGDISREASVQRIALKGLSEVEVSTVIEKTLSQAVPTALFKSLYEKTDGNPLFVSEVAKILQQSIGDLATGPIVIEIPDGIQEAIGRRLNQLSDQCNDLLTAASVVGRKFGLRELVGGLGSTDQLNVLQALEEAIRAGIIEEHESSFRFRHVLIRDMLYDELSLVKKITAHRNVADTLVRLREEGYDHSLGEIARHYYHAIQGGQAGKAVEYAIQAAEHAAKYSAHDEAIDFYRLALEVLSVDEGGHGDRKAEIHLEMSMCMQHSGVVNKQVMDTLYRCIEAARERRQYDIFAEAACLIVYVGRHHTYARQGLAIIKEALSYLTEDNILLRAKVLAHLGASLTHNNRRREAEQFARQAVATAAASGDKVTQCHSLSMAILVLRTRPEKLSERISLGEQIVTLAVEADDGLSLDAAFEWLVLSYQESGDMERVRQLVVNLDSIAERFRFHRTRYFVAWIHAYLALIEGRWDEAQRMIDEAVEVGAGTFDGGAEGVYGGQMFLLNRELGRLPMIRGALQKMTSDGQHRIWKPGLLATYTELQLLDDARQVFEELIANNYRSVVEDELYALCLVYLTEACIALEDVDKARSLYQRLVPFSGQMLSHPTAACYGPADLYLGMLAGQMNDLSEAENLFLRATELCERSSPNIWSAHIRYRHAQVLRHHNFPGGQAIFVEKINESRSLAQSMGMINLLAKLDQLESDSPGDERDRTTTLTRRELEVLHFITQGKSNKWIAAELNRSLATVATHVRSILSKTHTANRTEAAACAREREFFAHEKP